MRTITATEASRSFAALLDDAERGNTVVITRGGRRIATLGPASAGNAGAVLDMLASASVDDDFAADVRSARDAAVWDGPAWPAG